MPVTVIPEEQQQAQDSSQSAGFWSTFNEYKDKVSNFFKRPTSVFTDPLRKTTNLPEAGRQNQLRAAAEQTRQELLADPNNLKAEIKQVVYQNIQSGNLDRTLIKNDVKRHIQTKVREQMLQKVMPKEAPSVGGFLKNLGRNTIEIVDGIGALLGIPVRAALSPIDTAKTVAGFPAKMMFSPQYREEIKSTYVDPILDEYKEYRHPLTKAYEDPLDVFLDMTAVLGLGAKASTTAGRAITPAAKMPSAEAIAAARKTIETSKSPRKLAEAGKVLDEARKANPVAAKAGMVLQLTGKVLDEASKPLQFKNLNAATKKLISKMRNGPQIVEDMARRLETRQTLTRGMLTFLATRNRVLAEINEKVGKLSDAELRLLPSMAEGITPIPKNTSREFDEVLGLMRSLANDQANFGIQQGKFTEDIVRRRRFAPLAKWLEENGQLRRVKKKGEPVEFTDLEGRDLTRQINAIKRLVPGVDPIYMRHFFTDDAKQFSTFFINSKPVRSFIPKFLRKSMNKDGYIGQNSITREQFLDVLERQAVENIKWQRNIKLINDLINHPETKPYKKGQKPLEGHTIFAPDGLLRFYKDTIDLHEELVRVARERGVGPDAMEVFEEAVSITEGVLRTRIAVGSPKLYQVPTARAKEMSKFVAPANPYVKLFYDTPMNAFRAAALAFYIRWHFNNVVGNTIFSLIQGDVFNPKAFYITHQAMKRNDVFPDELFGGVHQTERTLSGRLGSAVEAPLIKSSIKMHDGLLNSGAVGQIIRNAEGMVQKGVFRPVQWVVDKSFQFGTYTDNLFKGVAFINRRLKEERIGFYERMTMKMSDTLDILEKKKLSDADKFRVIEDVHKWYYYGLNLTDFERRVVRRAIPFYAWMRWATLYSLRVTTELPVRAAIIKNMARDYYMITGQNELPEYLRGSIPIGNDEDGTVYYLRTSGMNPFGHVSDFITEGVPASLLKASAPAVKTFMEQATGRDVFLGKQFTKKDVVRAFNGDLYKFDPETGEVEKVEGEKVKPGLLENLLRNYIPQYILLETALAGGQRRYTAEGLDEILKDLVRDRGERKAIIEDVLTAQTAEQTTFIQEIGKGFGVNIQDVTPEQEVARREAKERATSALLNRQIPLLNERVKSILKQKIMQEVVTGDYESPEALREEIKVWIGLNVEKLQQLAGEEGR